MDWSVSKMGIVFLGALGAVFLVGFWLAALRPGLASRIQQWWARLSARIGRSSSVGSPTLTVQVAERVEVQVKSFVTEVGGPEDSFPLKSAPPAPFLVKVQLTNVRCFEDVTVDLAPGNSLSTRVLMLGDNASGKSTILRAIALALCNDSDATTLMTMWPGRIIRDGQTSAEIRVVLQNPATGEREEIGKRITRQPDGSEALLPLSMSGAVSPQRSVFISAYGTQRTRTASTSFESYSPRLAVATLFDESATLQNPEIVLLRQSAYLRGHVETLLKVMLLDPQTSDFLTTDSGVMVRGPWGEVPLSALSDGYRSTTQWLMDLFAWLVHASRLGPGRQADGIVLIDEIEQHLHPRWQRYIIQRLSEHLPGMQILATTHTPLVASGLADVDLGLIVRLNSAGGSPQVSLIDPKELRGKRADQVLTEFFELLTTRNPGSSDEIARLTQLRTLSAPTIEEARERELLEQRLKPATQFSENDFERRVDEAVSRTLDTLIAHSPREEFEREVKRQLAELMSKGGSPS